DLGHNSATARSDMANITLWTEFQGTFPGTVPRRRSRSRRRGRSVLSRGVLRMKRHTHALRAVALAGAVALALTPCAGGTDEPEDSGTHAPADTGDTGDAGDASPLIIGSLLPQTGSLAFLGPPEIAGVDLAIQEINEAGGVLGSDVVIEHADSSDADNAEVATQSVTDLMSRNVQVIIG